MPKNLKQEIIYTIMMVCVMVYAMVCYNITIDHGGLENWVFLAAFRELPIMGVAGFVLDTFLAGPIAKKLAFRLFQPEKEKPIFIILAISIFSIWLMCPMMSFVASILFQDGLHRQLLSVWIELTIRNFPMAFFWQLFAAGPLVRTIFGRLFPEKQIQG
ncbi:MAG: DUF2798 domain-containing protein [Eubacteriales bacterium]|nr:DUF2798 domain-containing protein [Eubacteriales bacterium]